MKRLGLFVLVFSLVPASVAAAAEMTELLEESQEASYTAEQLITCNTPDGVRDTLIDLEQRGQEIRYGSRNESEPLIRSGYGGWTGPDGGSRIETPSAQEVAPEVVDSYQLSEGTATEFLGRAATRYTLRGGDVTRAELTVDNESGVFLNVVTFNSSGEQYCERRFVAFDTSTPQWDESTNNDADVLEAGSSESLPATLGDFSLVDVFHDDTGLTFAYYSDGFFSFAVFRSPVPIAAAEANTYTVSGSEYQREFGPGQVTYTWAVGRGGMALIGDLPPDMHDAILIGLDAPTDPGFLNRIWRSIFG